MPILDMPINELEKYFGSDIKAQGFEKYWKQKKRALISLKLILK